MSEETIATLTLAAGSYILNAAVSLELTTGSGLQTGYCVFNGPVVDFGIIAWGMDDAAGHALAGAAQLQDAGAVTLACAHTAGTGTIEVNSVTFAAIQVATLIAQ